MTVATPSTTSTLSAATSSASGRRALTPVERELRRLLDEPDHRRAARRLADVIGFDDGLDHGFDEPHPDYWYG